jgi:hypothetical protein
MPTPESEAFLAKKPTVPPTFIGVDFLDNQAVYDARDAIIREQWVQQMMARLVREELGMCWILLAGLVADQEAGLLGGGLHRDKIMLSNRLFGRENDKLMDMSETRRRSKADPCHINI